MLRQRTGQPVLAAAGLSLCCETETRQQELTDGYDKDYNGKESTFQGTFERPGRLPEESDI